MSKNIIYENIPELSNPVPNISSEQHLNRENSVSSGASGTLPTGSTNTEQTTSLRSTLSRFPDDFSTSTDDPPNRTSSHTELVNSAGQDSTGQNHSSPPNTNDETHSSEQVENLGRFDNAWKEHERKQQQQEIIELLPKNESGTVISSRPVFTPSDSITRTYVREFLPTSDRDPTFSILRNLFVRSFDEYYQKIETQLNLKSDNNLLQWLDKTFDEEQEEIIKGIYRCFLLCGTEGQEPKEIVIGFLTLREEGEQSVYIAQVAVRLDIKRRGYGAQLLQHLRSLYPLNTQYWGLCRRANKPALQFYLKQGAKFMKDDDIATKYGYDPKLYAGFEFADTVPVIPPPIPPSIRFKPNDNNPNQQTTTITNVEVDSQNPSSINEHQQTEEEQPITIKSKVVGCCVIS